MFNLNRIALTKSRAFLFSCLAFIIGTAVASFASAFAVENKTGLFFVISVLFIALVLFWREKAARSTMLPALFLFLAVFNYAVNIPDSGSGKIWHYNGQKAEITGIVIEEPDERETGVKLKIESEKIDNNDVSGAVLVAANIFPKYSYGDELEIGCRLQKPESDNFPYDRYLARYDIYSICFNPKIKKIGENRGNVIYASIFKLKERIREKISLGLTEPEAGLAKGFILGDLKGIDDELSGKFSRSGLSHIVAISGANISIVAAVVMNACFWIGMGRKKSFYASTVFLIFYIILVGAPASAMRAGLMGFLVLWALHLGRLNKSLNAISFAAALMLFSNPKLLRDDIGFQLSFLAVIGVIHIYPSVERLLEKMRIPDFLSMREAMGMTIAAQILTVPIMIYDFGQVSLVAIPANILVSWALLPLMIIIPISILVSFAWSASSLLVFILPGLLLKYVILVAEKSADIPGASLEIYFQGGSLFFVMAYYVFWVFFIYKKSKNILAAS